MNCSWILEMPLKSRTLFRMNVCHDCISTESYHIYWLHYGCVCRFVAGSLWLGRIQCQLMAAELRPSLLRPANRLLYNQAMSSEYTHGKSVQLRSRTINVEKVHPISCGSTYSLGCRIIFLALRMISRPCGSTTVVFGHSRQLLDQLAKVSIDHVTLPCATERLIIMLINLLCDSPIQRKERSFLQSSLISSPFFYGCIF